MLESLRPDANQDAADVVVDQSRRTIEEYQVDAAMLMATCNRNRLAHASDRCCCWAEVVGHG